MDACVEIHFLCFPLTNRMPTSRNASQESLVIIFKSLLATVVAVDITPNYLLLLSIEVPYCKFYSLILHAPEVASGEG